MDRDIYVRELIREELDLDKLVSVLVDLLEQLTPEQRAELEAELDDDAFADDPEAAA